MIYSKVSMPHLEKPANKPHKKKLTKNKIEVLCFVRYFVKVGDVLHSFPVFLFRPTLDTVERESFHRLSKNSIKLLYQEQKLMTDTIFDQKLNMKGN